MMMVVNIKIIIVPVKIMMKIFKQDNNSKDYDEDF